MNITEIKLITPGDVEVEHASFMVTEPTQSDRYILKAATGLDAEEIVPTIDGNEATNNYYNMVLGPRTVVFLIKLNPEYQVNQTLGDLRDILYKIISYNASGIIEIRFMNEEVNVASLTAFISKVETNLFSSEPELQITFTCNDPFFRASGSIVIDEFVTLPPPTETSSPIFVFDDDASTAPHGCILHIHMYGSSSGLVINSFLDLIIDYAFINGDDIYVSSEYNNKYVYVDRASVITHLGDKLTSGSRWPMVFPGENQISFSDDDAVLESVSHRPSYWGI